MSKDLLLKEARASSYKPEILEKVYRLLSILNQFASVPYLRERLVLKGGTALNLFCFKEIPRLSVDIDFNYVG
jgi:predicted nucleotidyltransferase component of viral defense system